MRTAVATPAKNGEARRVRVFIVAHAPRGFYPIGQGGNGGELAIVYCFVFLYFFVAGAGAWALDNVWTAGAASGETAAIRASAD